MVSVSIIGIGRVGGALAMALPPEKYLVENLVVRGEQDVSDVTSRLPKSPTLLRGGEIELITSDIIFVTTQDPWIVPISRELALKIKTTPTVFHTSGSYPSSILDDLRNIGCSIGSIHPLVSISSPVLGPERFRNAFFCVEGMTEAVDVGMRIVDDLHGKPFSIDTNFKTLYHAAAVTACGHLVALFDAAVEMMTKCGLTADDAKKILIPLVSSTVSNLDKQSTAAALTGTFARADIETFTRHLSTLNANVSDELLEIYLLLGERSLELATKQGVSPERIDSLRTKVSIAKSKLKW